MKSEEKEFGPGLANEYQEVNIEVNKDLDNEIDHQNQKASIVEAES